MVQKQSAHWGGTDTDFDFIGFSFDVGSIDEGFWTVSDGVEKTGLLARLTAKLAMCFKKPVPLEVFADPLF